MTAQTLPPSAPVVRATDGPEGDSQHGASAQIGRTGWDFLTSSIQSKLLIYTVLALIASVIDAITALPFYIISSVVLSMLWYAPITKWLSRHSTYIEVFEPESGLLTTYRVGRQKFAELSRKGLQNQIGSRLGNTRVFADTFSESDKVLNNSWVHECTPWNYHKDRQTLLRLTERVSEVYGDIVDGEAVAQVEGRIKAMEAMRRHYADLDSIFFGGTKQQEDDSDGN